MQEHGTASEMSKEQFREFAGAVLRCLPDDLDTEVAQGWIKNAESLRLVLRETLSPNGRGVAPEDDFRDILPDGWEVVENVEGEPISISELGLVSFLKRSESYVSGEEMCRRAKEMGASHGLRQARRFLEEQEKAPRGWRKFYLPLAGARVRTPGSDLDVPYLGWGGGRWELRFRWLGRDWYSGDRLLRRK